MSNQGFLFFLPLLFTALASDDEYRLLQDLRKNYDPLERPVYNHSEPVVVNLKLLLQQLVDLDEKNQVITLVLWIQQVWNDYKLKWDPDEYGGIREVRFPSSADGIWKPDVLLFNSADEKFDASFPVNFIVHHDGEVLIAPPSIVKSSCEIDITWFPFDEQICTLRYGSWTYTGNKLDLHIDAPGDDENIKMDLSYYVQNGEWDLLGAPAIRQVSEFNDEKYIELHFRLHLRRKTVFYGLNWIIPSVLISLSNVLGFSLPPESGEKITLQITNLLSVTVFLGMVYEVTPPTSESVPIIAAFFSVSMLILGCSVMITVLIINLHFRTPRTHEMSSWTKKVFLEWLPWLLLMNRPGRRFRRPVFKRPVEDSVESIIKAKDNFWCSARNTQRLIRGGSINSLNCIFNEYLISLDEEKSIEDGKVCPNGILPNQRFGKYPALINTESNHYPDMLTNTLQEISDFLKLLRERMEDEDKEEEGHDDWCFVAMVVDRFCLFLFSGAILLASFFVIFNNPSGFFSSLTPINRKA